MLSHAGILGVPNKREQNQKWLPHPCLQRGPNIRTNATSPLHSQGSPTPSTGSKIKSGHQQSSTKSQVAAGPKSSWGPKRGRDCYITPTFSKFPNTGKQTLKWLPHPCLLGGPKEDGNAMSPLHSRGSQQRGTKSEMATSPLLSRGPKRGRKCYVNPAFSESPNKRAQKQ